MLKFAANLSFLFTQLPFEGRFQAARDAGFNGCEFLFPYDHAPEEVSQWAQNAEIEIVLFNLYPGDWQAGERGLAALPGRQGEFEAIVEQGLLYAHQLENRNIHVMAGIGEGNAGARETYLHNLDYAARKFAPLGITVLIEPINPVDMPGYFLNSVEQAKAIITELGHNNVKLQYDAYHRAMMSLDIVEGLAIAAPVLGHVQIAGVPGRHEPDCGELKYRELFAALETMNYSGWIGCEYRPKTNTLEGLGWCEPYLQHSRNAGFHPPLGN